MSKSAIRRVHSHRPSLESLESRALLSTVHLLVDTLTDDPSGPVAGQTTLRDAITAADAGSAANKYVIKFAVNGTIALGMATPLVLKGNIAIKGPGEGNLIITGYGSQFSFGDLLTIDAEANVKLSSLSFLGDGTYGLGDGEGGAIHNSGTLVCSDVNASDFAVLFGGGIFNDLGGVVHVSDSIFSNDTAAFGGGAILNEGSLTVHGTTFNNDTSPRSAGGAIANAQVGVMIISESTFSNDNASVGADIFNAGTATIGKKIIADLGTGIYNAGTIN